MWYIYILKSVKHSKYVYIGSTNDVNRRLKEHNSDSSNLCTTPFRPLKLEAYIGLKTEKLARSFEKYLKSGSGKAFTKRRILTAEAC